MVRVMWCVGAGTPAASPQIAASTIFGQVLHAPFVLNINGEALPVTPPPEVRVLRGPRSLPCSFFQRRGVCSVYLRAYVWVRSVALRRRIVNARHLPTLGACSSLVSLIAPLPAILRRASQFSPFGLVV